MKKSSLSLLLIGILFSCNKPSSTVNPEYLNGYWEIEKVNTSEGKQKLYNYNAFIDFFETKNQKGYRSKVKPVLVGKYQSNQQKIHYDIVTQNDSLFINYTSEIGGVWKDYIKVASSTKISLVNSQGTTYTYKPHKPIKIEEEKTN